MNSTWQWRDMKRRTVYFTSPESGRRPRIATFRIAGRGHSIRSGESGGESVAVACPRVSVVRYLPKRAAVRKRRSRFLFPCSTVYYLIGDVILRACIGHYVAISTGFTAALSAVFNFFIQKLAMDHMLVTFLIIGALYLVINLLLFRYVSEGQYPPVEDGLDREGSLLRRGKDYVIMFFRQCFQHRIFVFLFLCMGLNQASTICRSMYNIFLQPKILGSASGITGASWGLACFPR